MRLTLWGMGTEEHRLKWQRHQVVFSSTPRSSISGPQSLMEPLHPRKSSGGPFSVAWAAGDVCVCCVHVSLHPSKTFGQHWFCLCVPSPASRAEDQPHLPPHFLGSWQQFQHPSQQQAHPGVWHQPHTSHPFPAGSTWGKHCCSPTTEL